mmetsp:Transcript_33909/g.80790  ORF Transcript_33909/g.80790 Transcript_33909/m.80790 type:complete len:244 (-) Transcript_33909:142-873(-)
MKVVPVNDSEIPPNSPDQLPKQVVMMSNEIPCDGPQMCYPVTVESAEAPGATESCGSTTFESIQGIQLKGPFPSENKVSSSLLWAQRPVVILIVRRLGCPLCRLSFKKIYKLKDEFDRIGVSLIAISNQSIYAEDFIHEVWSGLPLYIDEDDRFRDVMGAPVFRGIWLCKPAVLKKIMGGCCGGLPKGGGTQDVNKKSERVGGDLVVTSHGIVFERNEDSTFNHTEPLTLLKAARKARGFPEE